MSANNVQAIGPDRTGGAKNDDGLRLGHKSGRSLECLSVKIRQLRSYGVPQKLILDLSDKRHKIDSGRRNSAYPVLISRFKFVQVVANSLFSR